MRYFLALIAISVLFFPSGSCAQEYTTWGLPDGARARSGKGRITAIRFSPDGSLLAVGSTVGLWLYDAHTGKEIALLRGIGDTKKIVFSPNGELLASAGWGIIQLWDVATYSELHTFPNNITSRLGETMAFTTDGKTLICLGGKWEPQFQAWDVHSGELLPDIPARKRRALPVRKDEELSLTVSTDDPGHQKDRGYYAQALSPDGLLFASAPRGITIIDGVSDGEIRLTDVRTGEVIPTAMPMFALVDGIVFSPDGRTLADVGRRHGMNLWDIRSSRKLTAINLPTRRVNALVFSPDGKTFAIANAKTEVRLREVSTGKRILSFTSEPAPSLLRTDALALAFSPNGETLAIATESTVEMWDVHTGQRLSTLAEHPAIDTLITNNQNFLSVGFQWRDIQTGQIQADLTPGVTALVSYAEEIEDIWAVALSPDGTTFATGSEAGLLHLWNARTGELLSTLRGHTGIVTALAFTADSALLASASKDGTIRLWAVATGQLKATLTEHDIGVALETQLHVRAEVLQPSEFGESQEPEPSQPVEESEETEDAWNSLFDVFVNNLAFSPNGATLASASLAGTIWLWEVDTARLIATLKEHEPWMKDSSEFAKVGLAFSPDSTRLASSSWDGTIMISGMISAFRTEEMPLLLPGKAGPEFTIQFTALAWAPDGTRLVSGSMAESLQIWDTETGTELRTIQGHTGGITGVAFSQNGKTVASASKDGTILLWDWDKITAIR